MCIHFQNGLFSQNVKTVRKVSWFFFIFPKNSIVNKVSWQKFVKSVKSLQRASDEVVLITTKYIKLYNLFQLSRIYNSLYIFYHTPFSCKQDKIWYFGSILRKVFCHFIKSMAGLFLVWSSFLGHHVQKDVNWSKSESFWSDMFDLSIASTKTKYIKLNTKTQNIFCRLNENLTTFLYTLTGATKKQKVKKSFLF